SSDVCSSDLGSALRRQLLLLGEGHLKGRTASKLRHACKIESAPIMYSTRGVSTPSIARLYRFCIGCGSVRPIEQLLGLDQRLQGQLELRARLGRVGVHAFVQGRLRRLARAGPAVLGERVRVADLLVQVAGTAAR